MTTYFQWIALFSVLIFSFSALTAQDTIIHYTETTAFDHQTREVSLALFEAIGEEHGFVVIQDDEGSTFNKTTLAQAQVVIFSNTSGFRGLSEEQQEAMEWFVDTLGRHILGIHAATDTYRHSSANGSRRGAWDWYAETIGGSVQNAPNHTFRDHVDTIYHMQNHPAAENISFPWVKEEEYYYWENGYLREDIQTILQVGNTGPNSYDRQRPVAWYRTSDNGAKVFYTSLGHKQGNFTGDSPEFEQLITDAVLWLLGCPAVQTSQSATICTGETYAFDGQALSASGAYRATYQTAQGCDSTVVLTLAVLPGDTSRLEATACVGEAYNFNGQSLSEPGTYTATFENSAGCDSTVFLTLDILPTENFSLDATVCAGEAYNFNGQLLDAPGAYTAVFQDSGGCDSTVLLNLSVLPSDTVRREATVCAGETYAFDGRALSEPGAYTAVFQDSGGCDSTVLLNLSVLPSDTVRREATVCAGETYAFDGRALSEPGAYTAVFQDSGGCDSTVLLNLSILPSDTVRREATVCTGETYAFDGRALSEPGAYTAVFQDSGGCDSTVLLNLSVLPSDTIRREATVCAGETYAFDGRALSEPGAYTAVFQDSGGCDSTVLLNLSVLPSDTVRREATVCTGETYAFDGRALSEPGTYTAVFQDSGSCDSTVLLNLSVLPSDTFLLEATICIGETYNFGGYNLHTPGTYMAAYQNALGCDSVILLQLEEASIDIGIIQDGTTLNAVATDAEYQWLDCNNGFQAIEGAINQSFTPLFSGSYAVEATNSACVDTSACRQVMITSLSGERPLTGVSLYPNPTGEQVRIDLGAIYQQLSLQAYTASGRLMYQRQLENGRFWDISLSHWPSGTYYLHLRTHEGGAVLPFVKK